VSDIPEPDVPTSDPSPRPRQSSLLGRLTGMFVSPGEVFDETLQLPASHANWVAPIVLSLIVGVVFVLVMFSQPRILQKIQEQQEAALDQQVEAGKLTEAQRDQALEGMKTFVQPGFLKVAGSLGVLFVTFLMFFGITFALWILAQMIWKTPFAFLQGMQVVGLAWMINILGGLVSMLLMVLTSRPEATLSPALLLSDFNPMSTVHACLGALNVFAFWFFGVLSLGLSRLTRQPWAKAAIWVFGAWIILKFVPIVLFTSMSRLG